MYQPCQRAMGCDGCATYNMAERQEKPQRKGEPASF